MPILGIYAASVQKASGAFESIATVNGTGSSASITFSSISGTYQHLQIRAITKDTSAFGVGSRSIGIRINSDTGSNYAYHSIIGNGSSASANGVATQTRGFIGEGMGDGTANVFAVSIIDIHDYASTSKTKTIRSFNGVDNNGTGRVSMYSTLWNSTSAITSITLLLSGDAWTSTSSFALYGIKG